MFVASVSFFASLGSAPYWADDTICAIRVNVQPETLLVNDRIDDKVFVINSPSPTSLCVPFSDQQLVSCQRE